MMKIGDLVQEDTEQDIGIVVGCNQRALTTTPSVVVFSFNSNREEIWSKCHTEVISESR